MSQSLRSGDVCKSTIGSDQSNEVVDGQSLGYRRKGLGKVRNK